MNFPYGISDFYKVSSERYFYVDRTERIPVVEEAGDHLLFLRPRPFGKTLLLSTLRNYYDLVRAEEFDHLLFNDTFYIMDSETALEREYADLAMIIRADMRKFQLLDILIEFKYISVDEFGGRAKIQSLSRDELKALSPVKHKLKEVRQKLQGYRRTLQAAYRKSLQLRTYSICSSRI